MSHDNNSILQIHPTRQCNLRCLHCYSASSPEEKEHLSVNLLRRAISDASREGYQTVSFSGGEPILYKSLLELLDHAHQCKMRTAVASNGMLLNEQTAQKFQGAIDLLAISLDGKSDFHNQMRGHKKAFQIMKSRLKIIRKLGIKFGFIFTLSHQNFRHLNWVANFALEQGASLLQIHLLENIGRAKQNLPEKVPSSNISAYAYLEAMKLRQTLGDRIHIQVDLNHQESLRANPRSFFAESLTKEKTKPLLANVLNFLIIEANGMVVPGQHGFARKYALGNLKETSLEELTKHWYQKSHDDFYQLCEQVYTRLTMPRDFPIVNWNAALFKQAEQITSSRLAS